MKKSFKTQIPIEGFDNDEVSFALISFLYENSSIEPVPVELIEVSEISMAKREMSSLAVEGEIISPLLYFFDARMFVLDYRRV